MRSLISLTLITLALSGCAKSIADIKTTWVGRPITERVNEVGQPDAVMERADGEPGKVYRWVFDSTMVLPGLTTPSYSSGYVGGQYVSGTTWTTGSDTVIPGSCMVDAWTDPSGKIVNITGRGRC